MLFIALIVAACLYVGLYLLWEASQSHLTGSVHVLQVINDMILTPRTDIFFLLRGLILVVFLYVVADFIYSTARRTRKNQVKKSEAAAKTPKPESKQGKPAKQ